MKRNFDRVLMVVLVLVLSVIVVRLWSISGVEMKVGASATDRSDRLVLSTGYVAPDLEAVYCLDQTTGRLAAGVLSRRDGKFQGLYERNINNDLASSIKLKGGGIPVPATPRYTMVTGELDAENRGSSLWKVAKSVVYIAEANTGMVMVYTIPWQMSLHGADQPSKGMLELWTAEKFQSSIVTSPTIDRQ